MHTSGSILITSWDDDVLSPFMNWIREQWSMEVQKLPSEASWAWASRKASHPLQPPPLPLFPPILSLFLATPVLHLGLCIYQSLSLEHDTAATFLQSCPTPQVSLLDLPTAFPDPAVQATCPLLVHAIHPSVTALCLLDGSCVLIWLSPPPTPSVIHSHTFPEPCGLGPVLGSGPTIVSKQ